MGETKTGGTNMDGTNREGTGKEAGKDRRETVNLADAPEMVRLAKEALEDKKGQNVKIIDISRVSVLADYFIIADGSNPNQVQAMVDNVEEVLGKAGYPCRQIEGYGTANWILMDYGDMIVHAFCREDRLFYDLERIWRDGRLVETEDV